MADIKLDKEELDLFAEVGSRGDYYRKAVLDRAADQVNETGQRSEITSNGGEMVGVVMAPPLPSMGETVTEVVKPSDLASVVGKAADADPDPERLWPAKDPESRD